MVPGNSSVSEEMDGVVFLRCSLKWPPEAAGSQKSCRTCAADGSDLLHSGSGYLVVFKVVRNLMLFWCQG